MKKNFMRFLAGFIYSSLIIFSLPVSSHDMLGSAEFNPGKSEWEVSCYDYNKVNRHHWYDAQNTITALAYRWKLPKAEFKKHFLRDDSGQLRYDYSNIKPSTTNPTPNQFICDNRDSRDEIQRIITKPISYWKFTCNPETFMTTTKNDDHLVALLNNTVGDAGPEDKSKWDKYVKELFDYNYKTKTGFRCPNNDFIRLILWPYDGPGQTAGVTSSSTTAVLDCSTIPDEELTTITNKAQCPNEIADRKHQRNKNEEINKINEKLSSFEKSITKDDKGKTLASKILHTNRYNEIVGEINNIRKEYKNSTEKEISDKLNDINALIKPLVNFRDSYNYYKKICINKEAYKLQYSSPEDYSDKCSEINSDLKNSSIGLPYIEASIKNTWDLEKKDGFYKQYRKLISDIKAYQAKEKEKAAKEKKVKEKAVIDKEIEKINNQNQIIKQRLKNLKELFEEELINEQEYNQKKQEILDQL